MLLSVKSEAVAPAGKGFELALGECGGAILFLRLTGIRGFVANVRGSQFAPSFGCLAMRFNEPQPFIYAARDFREQVGCVGIPQLVCLINGNPRFVTKRG